MRGYKMNWGFTRPVVGQIVTSLPADNPKRQYVMERARLVEPMSVDGHDTFKLADVDTGVVRGKRVQAKTIMAYYAPEVPVPPPPKPAKKQLGFGQIGSDPRTELIAGDLDRRADDRCDRLVAAIDRLTGSVEKLVSAVLPTPTAGEKES